MSDERFERRSEPPTQHHPHCKISHDRRATRDTGKKYREDVGLQRDYESVILAQCGMKLLRCWLETHLDVCFEMKGKCFYPGKK